MSRLGQDWGVFSFLPISSGLALIQERRQNCYDSLTPEYAEEEIGGGQGNQHVEIGRF